jgi:hypothetical protein
MLPADVKFARALVEKAIEGVDPRTAVEATTQIVSDLLLSRQIEWSEALRCTMAINEMLTTVRHARIERRFDD